MALVGLSNYYRIGNGRCLRVRTCAGTLNLRYDLRIKTGTPIPRTDVGFWGFRYKRWMWRAGTIWLETPQHTDYHVREIGFPFWALCALLAAYPTVALIRGPIRRRRWRRSGLCLKCGYNLRGLIEPRCPECATEFDPAILSDEM